MDSERKKERFPLTSNSISKKCMYITKRGQGSGQEQEQGATHACTRPASWHSESMYTTHALSAYLHSESNFGGRNSESY